MLFDLSLFSRSKTRRRPLLVLLLVTRTLVICAAKPPAKVGKKPLVETRAELPEPMVAPDWRPRGCERWSVFCGLLFFLGM